jgi:hypothetical protein
MARKLGDVAIAVTILVFLVGAFTTLIVNFDSAEQVSSMLSSDLVSLDNGLENASSMETEFTDKVDVTAEYVISENTDVDTTGNDAGGILNLFSKNVLFQFFTLVSNKLHIPARVIALVTSLIGITITILIIRFWRGESKA